MCGIGGIVRLWHSADVPPPDVSIPDAWLDTLEDAVKHRGPDGRGRFRDRVLDRRRGWTIDVALVHRRLAVIDPAGGHQPMVWRSPAPAPADPSLPAHRRSDLVAVVFNGCIYNHRDLRRQLQAAGHEFATDHSDTEVLLHGWREWGEGLRDKLEGMYAAAVWEADAGKLALLRDPFGEKPLYTLAGATGDGAIGAWSSSFASLLRLERGLKLADAPGAGAERQWLQGWIQFGWNQHLPHPRISETFPGSMNVLDARAGGELCWATHSFSPLIHDVSAPRHDALDADTVDALLRTAVHARLDADAPLGLFLSGGIDSALIARYAAEVRPDITAFTVRMPAADYDESDAAAATARALGIGHEVLDCAPTPADDLVALIEQLGLPFGDSSLLPSAWVCRAARQRVKVALGGDGGDELFLGYERHAAVRWLTRAARLPRPALLRLADLTEIAASPRSKRAKSARFLRAAATNGYKDLLAIFPPHLARQLWPGAEVPDTTSTPWHGGLVLSPRGLTSEDHYNLARCLDLMFYLPCDLMRKSDTASMSVGLELRAPMLDRNLASRAIHASPASLMPRGQRKGLLRQIARRSLPADIVDRPKMGFAVPISEWFRTDFGSMKTLLMDRLTSTEPFGPPSLAIDLDRRFINRMLDEHMSRRRDHGQRLYMLLVLSLWADWLTHARRT